MVRVRVLGNDDLLGRSEGAESFILRDFYGGLAAVAFLFVTMLMVAAGRGRGRGRGRGHGRSRDVTERQEDHVSRPEIVQNCDREEVSLDINSSDGDNSNGEIRVNRSSVNHKPRTHSSGIYGKPPPPDKIRAIPVGEGQCFGSSRRKRALKMALCAKNITRPLWPEQDQATPSRVPAPQAPVELFCTQNQVARENDLI